MRRRKREGGLRKSDLVDQEHEEEVRNKLCVNSRILIVLLVRQSTRTTTISGPVAVASRRSSRDHMLHAVV